MRHLDLFSGIGGFALAAQRVWGDDHEVVSFCEIDPFCQKVLKKHWPDVPCCDDIKAMEGSNYGAVDFISGGFPCQPVSVAGNRQGQSDARWLWPDMLRVINAARPTWVLIENVANLANMGLDEVLDDLEASSFETLEPMVIPACAVGLPHRRDRVWIVAYADIFDGRSQRSISDCAFRKAWNQSGGGDADYVVENAQCARLGGNVCEIMARKSQWRPDPDTARSNWGDTPPRICGKSDGIPNRMDRLKSLGNAIVPQIAEVIMLAIKQTDKLGLFPETL